MITANFLRSLHGRNTRHSPLSRTIELWNEERHHEIDASLVVSMRIVNGTAYEDLALGTVRFAGKIGPATVVTREVVIDPFKGDQPTREMLLVFTLKEAGRADERVFVVPPVDVDH